MSLERLAIRQHLVSRLRGRTDAGSNVFANRTLPTETIPAIGIYFRGETDIQEKSLVPRILGRRLQIDFECIATGVNDDEASNNLDILSDQVEQAISSDQYLGTLVEDILLIGSSDIEGTSEGREVAFASTLTYEVRYNTQHPREDDLPRLVDFETAYADYNGLADDTVDVKGD